MTSGAAGARNGQALERRMIADVVRRLAVRDLPDDLALVQIDRGDAAVGRLQRAAGPGRSGRRTSGLRQPAVGQAAGDCAGAGAHGLRTRAAAPAVPGRSSCRRRSAAAGPGRAALMRASARRRRRCAFRDRRSRPASWCRRCGAGRVSVASGPSDLLTTGGVKIGPDLVVRDELQRLRRAAPA